MAELTSQMAGLNVAAALSPPASPEPTARSTTARSPPPNTKTVDNDGDLYLVVGSEKCAFQVDSRAMVRVSRVWKSMLTGGWSESRPASGAWIVTRSRVVPSNNPRAIEILLHIIHLNTRQIPRAADISVEELFQIAVAVDMYDLCGCLGLWAKGWCSAVSRIVKTTTEVEVLEQLGWIAWVFGDGRMFEHVLEQLVVEVEVDGEGGLVDAQGVGLGDNFLRAMDLLDHLATSRTQLITSLLAVLESTLQTAIFTSRTANPSPFCRSTSLSALRPDSARYKARADCTTAILGSLVQSLAAEDLFPFPGGPEDIFESASALKQRLVRVVKGVETLGVPGAGGKGVVGEEAHAGCNPREKLLRLLNDVIGTPMCAPTDAQKMHLVRTAVRIDGGEGLRT